MARARALGAVAVGLLLASGLLAAPVRAQEFVPPDEDAASPLMRFGLFGFGSRVGADFASGGQAFVSVTLDAGQLFTPRLRFRPSAEIGVGATTRYVGNVELLYRFTPDTALAVPYAGAGGAIWGQQGCNTLADCPGVWFQVVLGFEVRFRDRINWMLEYHGEDALRRHRFFIGLTTRRGS